MMITMVFAGCMTRKLARHSRYNLPFPSLLVLLFCRGRTTRQAMSKVDVNQTCNRYDKHGRTYVSKSVRPAVTLLTQGLIMGPITEWSFKLETLKVNSKAEDQSKFAYTITW